MTCRLNVFTLKIRLIIWERNTQILKSSTLLVYQVNNEQLPRDNNTLHLLLRMLSLGLSAWSMIDSQEFTETKLQPDVVTKFIPALLSLIVDDQVGILIELQCEPKTFLFCSMIFKARTGFGI